MKPIGPTYGQLMIEALNEAVGIVRGRRRPARVRRVALTARDVTAPQPPQYGAGRVRALRRRLRLSQVVFAEALNVSPATVRGWERGARTPEGASRRLLEIAERHPDALLEKLAS